MCYIISGRIGSGRLKGQSRVTIDSWIESGRGSRGMSRGEQKSTKKSVLTEPEYRMPACQACASTEGQREMRGLGSIQSWYRTD